ncbi:MAG: hypothetical protein FJW37_04465 [Acidobacteria bacterium]|nr:hypothetical protein [Acidobacteriota bacterium]
MSFLLAASTLLRQDGRHDLSFGELLELSRSAEPSGSLQRRLDQVLNTPVVAHGSGVRPRRPVVDGVGPVLRAASWNIERGQPVRADAAGFERPARFLERG